MRANPDFNSTYPYQSEPENGWGRPPTGCWKVRNVATGEQHPFLYPDAAAAALAAVRLANQQRRAA